MGCKNSKDAKEDKAINGEFERVNIIRFDEFFDNASQLLNNAEKIRSGLEDNRDKASEIAHTHLLKEPKYSDNVQVLFWALSAEANGKVADTGIDLANDAPYIKLDGSKVSRDSYVLYEAFTDYVKTVTDGPQTLQDILGKLEEMSKTLPELGTEAKNEIQGSSLDFAEKAKAIARIGKNSSKLPKELKKCQNLHELIKQAALDLKELAPQLPGLLSKADEVGAKAAAENVKKPGEVFEKYHTGARKVEKKAEKKEEKNEDQKEEKKDDKKEKKEKEAQEKKEKKEKEAQEKKEKKEKEEQEKKAKKEKEEQEKKAKKEKEEQEKKAKAEKKEEEKKPEAPKTEEKHEAPKAEETKHEAPKAEEHHEAPKLEEPKHEEPKHEEKPAAQHDAPEEVALEN